MPDDLEHDPASDDAATLEELWWFAYWAAHRAHQGHTPTEVADELSARATLVALELAADDAQR